MPVYEYKCMDCGFRISKIRKVEERDIPLICNVCKSEIPRVLSLPSYQPIPGGARTSWN